MSDTLLYTVQRLNWVRHGTMFEADHSTERFVRLPGATRLISFEDESEALADLARREEATRRAINPFCCHGPILAYQTNFDEDRLHDWLLDGDIEPPPRCPTGRAWIDWWMQIRDTLNEIQWTHVWRALDRVAFHEIVERVKTPVVYLVARIGWIYNDSGYDARSEGSEPIQAYRSRVRAEAERDRLEAESRREYRQFQGFDLMDRLMRQDPFAERGSLEVPDRDDSTFPLFYEILEVDVEEVGGSR